MNQPTKNVKSKQLIETGLLSAQSKKYLLSLGYALVIVVTALSLISYRFEDPSFIYETTTAQSTHNWLGRFGAYYVSLLLYFFGGTAWLIPLILLYIIRIQLFNLAWKREADRVGTLIFFLFISTSLANYYDFEWYRGIYPGGLCGILFSKLLLLFFSESHTELLLFVLCWTSWVIIARFSFILYVYPIFEYLRQIPWNAFAMSLLQGIKKLFVKPKKEEIQLESNFEQLVDDFKDLQNEGSYGAKESEMVNIQPAVLDEAKKRIPTGASGRYILPSAKLFEPVQETEEDSKLKTESQERARALEEKLERFGIKGKIVGITQGPVVTLFEYQPSIDTRISTIVAREDDLALALQALSLRILAPIPGRSVVGFEVAHAKRKPVLFSEVFQSKAFKGFKGLLPLILGKDTLGKHSVIDLAAMPHLLVAGSTGSGKSVGLHSMITSLLCSKTPEEVKFILIDPKRLEFAAYADIAHLIFPIVTDPQRAILVLKWAVATMEERYSVMSELAVRNAADLNSKFSPQDPEYMPFIVIVIDELADLMMTAGKDVEFLIARLAQMARAAGIHLITATQRPSVDVITGLIKVNFPSRIAYKVTSKVDSRTILDTMGAEKLLGKGDMLFLDTKGTMQRIHGAYVSEPEVLAVVNHIKEQTSVEYKELTIARKVESDQESDAIFNDVLEYLKNKDEISISLLQRVFRVGYNRSARIIDQLEANGHILPADGSKMRKVTKEL